MDRGYYHRRQCITLIDRKGAIIELTGEDAHRLFFASQMNIIISVPSGDGGNPSPSGEARLKKYMVK
jgi:hypothetical protein